MYVKDIKLFAKNEKELETVMQTVIIYSQKIGMEIVMEKCVLLIIKSRKQEMAEGIELPNQEKIRKLGEKETYKYFEILEADTIKQEREKKRNLFVIKLYSRNLIKEINIWAVLFVRYSGLFLKWTREELQQID